MTLTAAQAEIVRRFVAGEFWTEMAYGGEITLEEAESALRAALISKDARIKELSERLLQLELRSP